MTRARLLRRIAGLLPALAAAVAGVGGAGPAGAATSDVSPAGFVVTLSQEVAADPHRVYEALGQVGRWWNSAHTFSGKSANLSLAAEAGGCFCERWDGNSVEHGRVIYAARDSALRLSAPLGPLQGLGVNAVLTWAVAAKAGKTVIQVGYRVSGGLPSSGLVDLAGPVDGVLSEQLKRLAAYVDTGKPE